MKESDPKQILLEVFQRLRRSGYPLGIGELLAAYRAVEGGWGRDRPEALREIARLLWCHSLQETAEFEEIYNAVLAAGTRLSDDQSREKKPEPPRPPASPKKPPPEPPATKAPTEPPAQLTRMTPFPVRTPLRQPPLETGSELRTYWPLSRRSMVYTWRYLRRPVKDGPRDVLNVEATVEYTARQGFFLQPVYDRRENNYAHLVLLVDQNGSMVPFHRFTRDLVDTACRESTLQREQVKVMYFHNSPSHHLFRDPHLTAPLPLAEALVDCTPDSSVLLVSDAGSARGYRSMPRIRATTEFLVKLKRVTTLIAWLNPMPESRWASTSAQFIARLIPMFQMDRDGFSNAVDVLRGQSLHPHR